MRSRVGAAGRLLAVGAGGPAGSAAPAAACAWGGRTGAAGCSSGLTRTVGKVWGEILPRAAGWISVGEIFIICVWGNPHSHPCPPPFYSSFAGAESLVMNNSRVFILGALRRGRLSGGSWGVGEVTCPRSRSEAVAELENNMRCTKKLLVPSPGLGCWITALQGFRAPGIDVVEL